MTNLMNQKGFGRVVFIGGVVVIFLLLGLAIYNFSKKVMKKPSCNPGVAIVQFVEGATEDEIQRAVSAVGAKIEKRLELFDIYVLAFPKSIPVEAMLLRLKAQEAVKTAEADILFDTRVRIFAGDQRSYYEGQLLPVDERPLLKERTIVAVLDTGVYLDHEALKDYIYTNPGEIAGDGIDNDGNGYIDDVHGYDTYEHDPDPNPGRGFSTGHGTMVSGRLVAGAGGADIQIMPIRVGQGPFLSYFAILEGLQYAANNGAKVVNMSFGTSVNLSSFEAALNTLYNKGITLVAAAGNSGTNSPYYPTAYDCVIGVGATDSNKLAASFSNYGIKNVDLMAEGVNTLTTTQGGGYWTGSGTSFAAPFVAGLAALLLGYNPDLSPLQVKEMLISMAEDIKALNPRFTDPLALGGGFLGFKQVQQLAQWIGSGKPITAPPPATPTTPTTTPDQSKWLLKTEKHGKVYILHADGKITIQTRQ